MNNIQPIWADNLKDVLSKSKMGLNLSQGKSIKYYSSDRITQLIGNGLLTFMDSEKKFQDFFTNNEIIFFDSLKMLSDKLNFFKNNPRLSRKIAENGKNKYFIYGIENRIEQIIANLLEEHGVTDNMQLASLAKREETIHRNGHDDLVLDRRGRVLVHARDEAHRFVNKFHRKSRSKSRLSDPLESVEGLGAKKLQALLRHFGGRQGISHATVNDLKTVPGIGPSLAKRIYDSLH